MFASARMVQISLTWKGSLAKWGFPPKDHQTTNRGKLYRLVGSSKPHGKAPGGEAVGSRRFQGQGEVENGPVASYLLLFGGNMGYMSVKDENFPRAQGVLRGKTSSGPGGFRGLHLPRNGTTGILRKAWAGYEFLCRSELSFRVHP